MKSSTTGSSVKGLKKQARINRLEQAVSRTLEALESRVLMSAGEPDWSFNLSGFKDITNTDYPTTYYNDKASDPKVPFFSDPASPYYGYSKLLSDYTGVKINDVFTDAGGKVIVVGTMLGKHVVSGKRDLPDPDKPGEFIKDVEVRLAVQDNDYFVARLNPDGSLGTMNRPAGIGPGTRDYASYAGSYPASEDAFTRSLMPLYNDWAVAGAVNPIDGSIVTVGYGAGNIPLLVRYDQVTSAGYLAPSNGLQTLAGFPTFGYGDMKGLAMQADGKFFVYGTTHLLGTGFDFFVAKYNPDGSLDTTFNGGGTLSLNSGSYNADVVMSLMVTPAKLATGAANPNAGKIIFAGYSDDSVPSPVGGYSHVVLRRLNANGTTDTSFGVNGQAVLDDVGGKNGQARKLIMQGDGKIIVMGVLDNISDAYGAVDTTFVARLNPNGTLDTALAGRGFSYISSPTEVGGTWLGTGLGIEGSGKFVVAGVQDGVKLSVGRMTNTGRTDLTYNGTGFAATPAAPVIPNVNATFVSSTPITAAGVTPLNFTIKYDTITDYYGTYLSLVDSKGVPLNYSSSKSTDNPDGSETVVYTVSAPAGGWMTANSGALKIYVQRYDYTAHGYTDPKLLGSALVAIPDALLPSAILYPAVPAFNATQSGYVDFSVLFIPNAAATPLDLTSLAAPGLITVDGVAAYTSGPLVDNGDGTYTQAYQAYASTNGTSVIKMATAMLKDTATPANVAPGATLGNFDVNIQSADVAGPDFYNNAGPVVWIQPDGKALVSNSYQGSFGAYPDRATLSRFQTDNRRPTANLQANDVRDNTSQYYFTVTYTDEVMISGITLGSVGSTVTNLIVNGPGGTAVLGTLKVDKIVYMTDSTDANGDTVADAQAVSVRYVFTPATSWTNSNNGSYSIHQNSPVGAPTDLDGLPVQERDLGRFQVNIAAPDFTPPTVNFDYPAFTDSDGVAHPAGNDLKLGVSQTGMNSFTFRILFADAGSGVDTASLMTGNVVVIGPGGFYQIATLTRVDTVVDPVTLTTSAIAAYTITAPSGTFGLLDNGIYRVSIEPTEVGDLAQVTNYILPGVYGSFNVAVGTTPIVDTQKPVASVVGTLNPGVSKTGVTYYDFTVRYQDNIAINAATLGDNNIIVIAPNGTTQYTVKKRGVSASGNGMTLDVTYRLLAPGGTFDGGPLGTYTIHLQPNQVADTSANFADPANIGTFKVTVETVAPVATWSGGADLTQTNQTYYDFTVHYTDNTAVLFSTLGAGNVLVVGPDSISHAVTVVNITGTADAPVLDVTYRFAAPTSGVFDQSANGVYQIKMVANQVSDPSGNFVAAGTLGTFAVNVDSTVPTAQALSTPAITSAIGQYYIFSIQYDDNNAINVATIGNGNILVTGPDGLSHAVELLTVNLSNGGKTAVVTYRLAAPTVSGVWDVTANGSYQIMLQANQVADTSGNFALAGKIGSFGVGLELVKPLATLVDGSALSLNLPAQSAYLFTVRYSDNTGISVDSIDAADITIVGPGGITYAVTLVGVDVDSDGTPRSATYRFAAPAVSGKFDATTNGIYTIALQANQVADVSGNFANPVILGTLTVAVDTVGPTATIESAPTINTAVGQYYVFSIRYTDSNSGVDVATLGNADILVTGPTGISYAVEFLSSSVDGSSIIATYRLTAPTVGGVWAAAVNGVWQIALQPNQVADVAGNFAGGQTLGSFTVAMETQKPQATLIGGPGLTLNLPAQATFVFTVQYSDNTGISIASINAADISIVGPDGTLYAVTLVSVDVPTNGTPRSATYSFAAPGGTFGPATNGIYTIRLQANQVVDVSGNFADSAVLGTLTVGMDNVAPTATLIDDAIIVTDPTLTFIDFTVSYDDNAAIAYLTIGAPDILLVGPNNVTYPVTLVRVDQALNGKTRLATYRFTAPAGNFGSAANGDYAIMMQGAQVADTSGNFVVASNLGTLTVNVYDGVTNGVLTVSGTDGNDSVSITVVGTNYLWSLKNADGEQSVLVPISSVTKIAVLTYGGSDSVFIGPGVIGCYIDGGAGRDVVKGGQFNDTIIGGRGNDSITGGGGADLVYGGAGADLIQGGAGDDSIVGGGGRDRLFGQGGNDSIYANDGLSDIVVGGLGTNSAFVDSLDIKYNINTFLPTGTVPPPAGAVPGAVFAGSPLLSSNVNLLDLVASSKLV